MWWTPGRAVPSAAAPITSRIPAAEAMTDFPMNAYEAESRRMARFFKFGHTPGPMAVGEEKITKELPFTLDLRLQVK